jgi:hypothetical protein
MITSLEIRKGRHRLVLERVTAGPILAMFGAPVLYKCSIDGKVRAFDADAELVRSVWRGIHRWLFSKEVLFP